jgi:hypothetical protein
MEQFHLRLLQIYRDSSICPKNVRPPVKSPQEYKSVPSSEANAFLFPNSGLGAMGSNIPSGMQPSLFPMFPFSNYPKVEAQEGTPYIIDNKPANNQHPAMFDMSRFGMQPHPHQSFFQGPPELFPPLNRPQEKNEEVPVKNLFGEPLENSTLSFENFEYIQCVCEGKKGFDDKNSFQCSLCNFSYHLSCLKIESNPTGNSVCPLCILRKETVFCKVTYEPMKFNWHFNERGKELRV